MNAQFQQLASSWLSSHVNRPWDTDGFPKDQPYQCYDLAQLWGAEFGAPRFTGLYASDIITQAGSKFRRIDNDANFVPQAGDIMVWDRRMGGGFGHVAICTGEGDTNYFVSLDQNWLRPMATYIRHSYDNVIGVLRPLASEATEEAAFPTPSADNEGVVNGDGLRGRTDATRDASSPWYFDDQERVTILSRKHGQLVTEGPYAPSDWWYLVQGRDSSQAPQVWVADAFIRTTKNPANVPDWKAPTTTPKPVPVTEAYTFTKDLDCVTEVKPAGRGNFEIGNFPQNQDTVVIHDFGTEGHDTVGSTINEFTRDGSSKSAQFVVSGKRIIQVVSLKDRAYHAGSQGNNYVGIETDPAQTPETIESTKTLLRQLRDKYGRTLKTIKHSSLMATSCGDDVNLEDYDIAVVTPPIPPNPPADPDITRRLTELELVVKYIQDWLSQIFKGYVRR